MTDRCLKCGSCVNACPVQKIGYPSFVASRLEEAGENKLWLCTNCWLCQQVCPVGIDLWSIKSMLRRRAENVPEGVQTGYDHLAAGGFILPINEEINLMRAEQGLEPFQLPPKYIIYFLLESQ